VVGLLVSFGVVAALLVSGRMDLALGISVVSLMSLYALHSAALLLLPRRSPEVWREVGSRIPRDVQVAAGWVSVLTLGALVLVRFAGDLARVLGTPLADRWSRFELTSLELLVGWLVLGLALHGGLTSRRTD
jgi:hypothetical protein